MKFMSAMGFADHQSPGVMKATSRKTLGLNEGDDVTFILEEKEENKIEVRKKHRLSELFGILKTKRPFKPVDEIRMESFRKIAEKELQNGGEN
jgi:antitoxin PrlF